MVVCFTGRRPKDLCGYNHHSYTNFTTNLAKWLYETYGDDTTFITGGAQGFDQIAFWAVDLIKTLYPNASGIKNIVYVPLRGQDHIWKQSGAFSRDEYSLMLNTADEVVYLHEATENKKEIVMLLQRRNEAMVDASNHVIALYPDDGWRTAQHSGTANCMNYALRKNKTLMQIKYTIANNELIMPNIVHTIV